MSADPYQLQLVVDPEHVDDIEEIVVEAFRRMAHNDSGIA
jgi:hypothetical protein